MDGSTSRRIVLLGKTGAGKSSLANTIFGQDVFKTNHSPITDTSLLQVKTKCMSGRSITLIDPRSFFDTSESEDSLKTEIVRCITECAHGPHAFLIVLKVDKYTQHEMEVVRKICDYFSEDALKFAAVVFTHGDQLPDEMQIENFVSKNAGLHDLVAKCGGRCHVVDNKYWKGKGEGQYRSNQFHVGQILGTIEDIHKANGERCYMNEMLNDVRREIQKVEDNLRQSAGDMSPEAISNKAKNTVANELLIKLAGYATGALLGALLGMVEQFPSIVAKQGEKAALMSAAFDGIKKGSMVGYEAAKRAESVGDAVNKTIKALWDGSGSSGNGEGQNN